MKPSYGYVVENKIIYEMNGRKVKDLEEDLKDLVLGLFDNVDENDVVIAKHCDSKEKSDMRLEVNGVVKYISIKYGDKNSVHTEELKNFKRFIMYYHCGWDILEKYLKYHYADGTMDGSGEKRISVAEYKITHQKEIEEINFMFNQDSVLHEAYNRFIFKGIYPYGNLVDAILYCRDGVRLWGSRDEIIDYLDHKADMKSSGVHFSRLFIQPFARNLNYNPKHESRRHYIQVKWFDLYIAMSEIKHKRKTGEWLDVIV